MCRRALRRQCDSAPQRAVRSAPTTPARNDAQAKDIETPDDLCGSPSELRISAVSKLTAMMFASFVRRTTRATRDTGSRRNQACGSARNKRLLESRRQRSNVDMRSSGGSTCEPSVKDRHSQGRAMPPQDVLLLLGSWEHAKTRLRGWRPGNGECRGRVGPIVSPPGQATPHCAAVDRRHCRKDMVWRLPWPRPPCSRPLSLRVRCGRCGTAERVACTFLPKPPSLCAFGKAGVLTAATAREVPSPKKAPAAEEGRTRGLASACRNNNSR